MEYSGPDAICLAKDTHLSELSYGLHELLLLVDPQVPARPSFWYKSQRDDFRKLYNRSHISWPLQRGTPVHDLFEQSYIALLVGTCLPQNAVSTNVTFMLLRRVEAVTDVQ